MVTVKTPRNVRNNNPLNIRRSKDHWLGLSAVQQDSQFYQFRSSDYGYRAAFVILVRTYYFKYKLITVKDLVSRWAPPNENNTADYIKYVCTVAGFSENYVMPAPSMGAAAWMKLVAAMTMREGGRDSLEIFSLLNGWQMFQLVLKSGSFEHR